MVWLNLNRHLLFFCYGFFMAKFTKSGRRWTGAIFLTIAALMLILGETVFEKRLKGFDFLVYWLACAVFTFAAVVVAWLDMTSTRRQSRSEQRELIEKTLKED